MHIGSVHPGWFLRGGKMALAPVALEGFERERHLIIRSLREFPGTSKEPEESEIQHAIQRIRWMHPQGSEVETGGDAATIRRFAASVFVR